MEKSFSPTWKSSVQPRKQRKFRANAPLHVRTSFFGVHLSKDLRAKLGRRSTTVREGDTVKVIRGQHKGKTGKIRMISRVLKTVTIEGVEQSKRDGSKSFVSMQPSNLMLIDIVTSDKIRQKKMDNKRK